RAGVKVVHPDFDARCRVAPAGQVHVHVDAAREHVVAARLDFAGALHLAAQLRDKAATDADVAHALAARGDDRAATYDQVELLVVCHAPAGHVTPFGALASNDSGDGGGLQSSPPPSKK